MSIRLSRRAALISSAVATTSAALPGLALAQTRADTVSYTHLTLPTKA
nr:hypothetical protein [uncultured Brevundimonas sp.]